jgi:hypothetical protein
MANPEEIEREFRDYLDKEGNMRHADKLPYLMIIVNKHFGLDKIDHIMDYHDLDMTINNAKSVYAQTSMPMNISGKELTPSQTNYVLVLESFVSYLNGRKLLKRLIKIDHKEKK